MKAEAVTRRLDIWRLLEAQSVAIIGASEKPGALGNAVLRNLERHAFAGDIHLINPKRPLIGARQCLGSAEELPEGVDVAVLAIPGPAVLSTVRQLAARGVGAAIIFAAGFAEGGAEGVAAQAELRRIADETGMVIEGPNCLGLVNYAAGLPLTFVETPPGPPIEDGAVAIVSQSGAMAVVLGTTLMSKDLALSVSVSTGNEAASGVEDYLDYLLDEPATRVIGMIVEQFRQPRRFLEIARRAQEAGKTIVLLHPGTSSAARASAATHTGAMAGDWQVMRVLAERAGILLVEDLEQLGDVIELAYRCGRLRGGGTAVLTESGAFKALTLDLAERIGLTLPEPDAATQAALRATLPDFIGISNPMDLTAQALVDPDLYRRTLEVLLRDERYASIVFVIIQTDLATVRLKFEPIILAIAGAVRDKPILFAGMDEGAPVPAFYMQQLRKLGVAYFPSPDRAFRALGRLEAAAGRLIPTDLPRPLALAVPKAGVLPEYRAKRLLAGLVPFPEGSLCRSIAEAEAAAERIGYPLVLKAQADGLSHKSDAGGVLLNIDNVGTLRTGWERLAANIRAAAPDVPLEGVLVEAMSPPGVELIIGGRNDPDWGPVVLVGFGGVQAELTRDVRLLAPDLSHAEIIRELRALKSGALFDGFRGKPPLDIAAVATLIQTVACVLTGTPGIREIDLNPVVVRPDGAGVIALDALILAA